MTHTTVHPEPMTFSGRLRQRLSDMGVPVVAFGPDGALELIGPYQQEHELIIHSAPFKAAIRSKCDELTQRSIDVCTIWPGVMLVPIQAAIEAESDDRIATETRMFAALLLSRDMVSAEQIVSICNTSGMDLHTARARIDADALMSSQEAQRIARTIAWMVRDARDLGWRLNELHDLSWELARSYEELGLLYKLSTSMVVDHPPESFLQEACSEMREVVGLKWLAIQPAPGEPGFAELPVTVCVNERSTIDPEAISALGPAILEEMRDRTEPVILDDPGVLNIPGLDQCASNLLITPLYGDGRSLGLLYGADKISHDDGLSTIDSKLCTSLGSSLSIYLKNMVLYEDMHAMFLGTMHALSCTIDAKDSYTHGHSDRVALLARQLAKAAGLSDQTVERVYLSALVHDVGKIGVPEVVLTKPGRLTNNEYDLVKRHPEIGAGIIERIRQMNDLIPGVLSHHEAWDGSGYPHRLAGRNIPLFGRIIGLADAFDAMSSDRTYRQAMPMHKVLDEVRRCSGKQFDPGLVNVFVRLDFTDYLNALGQHHDRMRRNRAKEHVEARY